MRSGAHVLNIRGNIVKLTDLKPFEVAGFDIAGTKVGQFIKLSGGTVFKGGWPPVIELNGVEYTLENSEESEDGSVYAVYA